VDKGFVSEIKVQDMRIYGKMTKLKINKWVIMRESFPPEKYYRQRGVIKFDAETAIYEILKSSWADIQCFQSEAALNNIKKLNILPRIKLNTHDF
jgi:hypothetical protein